MVGRILSRAAFVFAFLLASTFAVAPASAETYRLQYEAAILGVVVIGQASYEVAAQPNRYAVSARVRTSGAARIFDQTDITATTAGTISGSAIGWNRYDLSHSYASKFRRINLTRSASGVAAQVNPRYGNMGEPAATPAQQSQSYDPLSAIFALGRQIGAARACQGSVLAFDGRGHYRLSVTPKSQGNFNGGGYNGPAVSCNFRYEPIAGFTMTAQERARIPVAEAWFGLPQGASFAPPLRLTVPTPVGDAQLDLRGYQAS